MNFKLFACAALSVFTLNAIAQSGQAPAFVPAQPYGKFDMADLELKACDFEKDANAEVLFKVGKFYYGADLNSMVTEVHKRVKIFTENGRNQANVRIEYYSGNHAEYISGLEAETVNLTDGKIEITKLDKKQIFTRQIDKQLSEITFAFPNVKPGSIIEYKYKWNANYNASIPYWYFQEDVPVRYSEISTQIPDVFYFRPQPHITSPLAKHSVVTDAKVLQIATHTVQQGRESVGTQETQTIPYTAETEVRGLANISSLPADKYMSSFADNVQCLSLQLVSVKPIGGFNREISTTWSRVAFRLNNDEDFGGQLNRRLSGEDEITSKAKALKTDEEKIAFIFNAVKSAMKWNGHDAWYTNDGTSRAWDNKSGNSAEINLILYHLLKQTGIKAYPMVVSTRTHGRVDPYYTSMIEFNRAVVYVPVDSTRQYFLDATGKYNIYNETPAELLNSMGLYLAPKERFDTVTVRREPPIRQVVLINAEIKPDGKLSGTAQVNSMSYDKIKETDYYKTEGEKKYIDYLTNLDNNLKVSSLKLENMEVDSLPLTQNIAFDLDLTGSDGNYIYLNANLFSQLKNNPFLSENRATDIYLGYRKSFSINGNYKIPAGYKTDVLPKSINMAMPDKSFTFKRFVGEQDGTITVHFTVGYNVVEYSKDNYPAIRDFFKKMTEMMNEQIVLKKG